MNLSQGVDVVQEGLRIGVAVFSLELKQCVQNRPNSWDSLVRLVKEVAGDEAAFRMLSALDDVVNEPPRQARLTRQLCEDDAKREEV